VLGAHLLRHASVVGQGVQALFLQPGGGFFHLAPRQAVHDAGFGRAFLPDEVQQLAAGVVLVDDGVADVGAVEAGDEAARMLQVEPVRDLFAGLAVGGGGERDARDRRIAFRQDRQLQVFRAEIMAPLRHAVGLVDGEQGQAMGVAQVVELVEEAWRHQPLGGDVQQVQFAVVQRTLDGTCCVHVQAGVEESRMDAGFDQCADLVLHQRDQW